MNILDLVVGKPIKTIDERAEQIGPTQGVPIFGLDGLSSAAYGPEAALSLLIPLGLLGVRYIVPISAAIITLLVIVYFSYRQTIAAYPSGGGRIRWLDLISARRPGCWPPRRCWPTTFLRRLSAFPPEWERWFRPFRHCCRTRFPLRGNSDCHYDSQFARRARSGDSICRADLFFCRDASDHHCRRSCASADERRASDSGICACRPRRQ